MDTKWIDARVQRAPPLLCTYPPIVVDLPDHALDAPVHQLLRRVADDQRYSPAPGLLGPITVHPGLDVPLDGVSLQDDELFQRWHEHLGAHLGHFLLEQVPDVGI